MEKGNNLIRPKIVIIVTELCRNGNSTNVHQKSEDNIVRRNMLEVRKGRGKRRRLICHSFP